MALLEISGASKRFGAVTAVDRVFLSIERGEFFALLGPSGCGKTTLLRLIAGFETPNEGRIVIDGTDITAVPPYARPVNMMFQSYALFPHLDVAGNIAFGLKQEGMPRQRRAARVEEMLALVQMAGFAKRRPHELSGGQKQRVALARALAKMPKLLLLDEPLSALDEYLRLRMRGELRRVQKDLGITFIHVTHGQDEAMALANIVVLMNAGRIEQLGTPRDIFNHPQTEFTAKFIGGHNVIAVGDESFAVRNDRLILKRPNEAVDGPRVAGTVSEVEYQGTYVRVAIAAEGEADISAELTESQFDAANYAVGERVIATWDPAQASPLKTRSSATVTSLETAA